MFRKNIFVINLYMGGQKIKKIQIITNGCLKRPKWLEDSDTDFTIQIIVPFLAKKQQNIGFGQFWVVSFLPKRGQMLFDLNFKASVGILSSCRTS